MNRELKEILEGAYRKKVERIRNTRTPEIKKLEGENSVWERQKKSLDNKSNKIWTQINKINIKIETIEKKRTQKVRDAYNNLIVQISTQGITPEIQKAIKEFLG